MSDIAKTSKYLIALLRAHVNGTEAEMKPESITWSELFACARRHSLLMMAYFVAGDQLREQAHQSSEAWAVRNAKLLAKSLNQNDERLSLGALFEENKIPYLPLKGSVLSALYPYPELREMTDLDILIPKDHIECASQLMFARGYAAEPANDHHLEFVKPPYLIVELHTDLMPKSSDLYAYYEKPWKMAVRSGESCCYHLSVEDEYIFLMAHAAKHYYYYGMGIRTILDAYIYHREYRCVMNKAYLTKAFSKMKLGDFVSQVEELGACWFGEQSKEMSEKTAQMAACVIDGSTFGSRENFASNSVRRQMEKGKSFRFAKFCYAMTLIFPSRFEMKATYPILEKLPLLLPIFWVIRWFRILFKKPASIVSSFSKVKQIEEQKSNDR